MPFFGSVSLYHYLILSAILFSIGAFGFIASRNAIKMLMCVEIMINAANINLVAFSSYSHPFNLAGQIFAIFSIALAAATAAIGLAIVLLIYRLHGTVEIRRIKELKW